LHGQVEYVLPFQENTISPGEVNLRTSPNELSLEIFFKAEENRPGLENNGLTLPMEQEVMNRRLISENTLELSASIKSIQTNFLVILLGITASIVIKSIPLEYQSVFSLAFNSAQKTLLPITTTLVNFSVIRKVGFQFWLLIMKK
jgi:hypothetical protein